MGVRGEMGPGDKNWNDTCADGEAACIGATLPDRCTDSGEAGAGHFHVIAIVAA
jgi:hypothetical protein